LHGSCGVLGEQLLQVVFLEIALGPEHCTQRGQYHTAFFVAIDENALVEGIDDTDQFRSGRNAAVATCGWRILNYEQISSRYNL